MKAAALAGRAGTRIDGRQALFRKPLSRAGERKSNGASLPEQRRAVSFWQADELN